ncbi:uncharacterized protein LOC141718734 [Apium graveolens]|uniref:uncharacterized protein LOC141718734 n=1 Tax=Apium graveolens TaxID=4045 RepID=UPI003D7A84D6
MEKAFTLIQKARRFQQGLKPEVCSRVVALQIKTYTSIVQAALVIESDQKLASKERSDKKRKFKSGADKADREESRNLRVTCFKCGKVGHIDRNCKVATQGSIGGSVSQGPATSTVRARTFKMTKRSNAQDSDVVAGTLSLNFVPVKVLFESVASKSFISKECVRNMDLMLEDLAEPLTIEVANQDKVSVSQFFPRCQLEICGHSFSVNLIPFELGEFDVILGMDWLSQHTADIDCKKNKIVLYTEDNVRVTYQGQKQEKKFISVLEARKLLR